MGIGREFNGHWIQIQWALDSGVMGMGRKPPGAGEEKPQGMGAKRMRDQKPGRLSCPETHTLRPLARVLSDVS